MVLVAAADLAAVVVTTTVVPAAVVEAVMVQDFHAVVAVVAEADSSVALPVI